MRQFAADLHVHTALSPCAASEMIPNAVVSAAIETGLDMIAICDHNSAGNVAATCSAAGNRLSVIAGMELTTAEEVHVLGFFPDSGWAEAAGREVSATLPLWPDSRENNQFFMDPAGKVTGREQRMLGAASRFDIYRSLELMRRFSGIAVAAHVDRRSFSVFSQLGFIPEDVAFDAIELSGVRFRPPWATLIATSGLPTLISSDSHSLETVGRRRTMLELSEPTFRELVMAIRGIGERKVVNHA